MPVLGTLICEVDINDIPPVSTIVFVYVNVVPGEEFTMLNVALL